MTTITVTADTLLSQRKGVERVIPRFEHLQVDGRQRAAAMAIASLLMGATVLTLPVAAHQALALPGIVPMLLAAALVADLVTALLVIAQFGVSGHRSLLLLASSFTFSALVMAAHLLTFRDLFAPGVLLGGENASAWLFLLWHAAFPVLVLAYVVTERCRPPSVPAARRTVVALATQFATFLVVALVAATSIHLDRSFPPLLVNDDYGAALSSGIGPVIWLTDVAVLVALLQATRGTRTIDLWLSVTVLALTLDMGLTLVSGRRYTVGWYVARANSLFSSLIVLSVFLSEVNRLYGYASRIATELEKLAFRDGLTGVANKRAFSDALCREWGIAARERRPLALVMCDLDCFKQFNDRYGHQAGDDCVQRVAAEVARCAGRPADLAARFGGEELAVLLPATDAVGAWDVAERIRHSVERLESNTRRRPWRRTSA
jgi:diguanylate cyclase (GGDEF)-like protein